MLLIFIPVNSDKYLSSTIAYLSWEQVFVNTYSAHLDAVYFPTTLEKRCVNADDRDFTQQNDCHTTVAAELGKHAVNG